MTLIDDASDEGYYISHHTVIKLSSNTIKERVVFDALMKTSNGLSLNDVLLVEPTVQDPLFIHLLRFREYKYVLFADIEKNISISVFAQKRIACINAILWRQNN